MSQDSDQRLRDLEQQIAEQEKLIRRMIERGTPNQGDEDRLRQLKEQLTQLKRAR